MSSSIVSLMLFLLLLVVLNMDHAFGAQTEIRKLKDTRMKLEGDDNRSSKVEMEPSRSIRCGGGKTFENMATAYRTDHGHLPGGYLSSLCQPCSSGKCIVYRCITTKICQYVNGSPTTCTSSEDCQPVSSN